MLTVIPCIKTLGRVDEFEVLTTKSMTCGKIGFATNSSKINGLVLIRQHALVLCQVKRTTCEGDTQAERTPDGLTLADHVDVT
jgi:hypothetical protein